MLLGADSTVLVLAFIWNVLTLYGSLVSSFQGRSAETKRVGKGGFDSPCGTAGESGDASIDSPGGGGGVLGTREFKAVEGLIPKEARLLVTSLVDDMTSAGIGEMLRLQEADKQASARPLERYFLQR